MQRFRSILVPVDTRFEEHPALELAARLASRNQAKLTIMDVVPNLSWSAKLALADPGYTQRLLAEEKTRNLESLAEPLRDQGLDVATTVLTGKTSFEIMHEVLRSSHDLVVCVTKGAGSQRAGLFGTTSMRLLRKCPCALWLVRPDARLRFARVLAAVDASPDDLAHQLMNKTIMELGLSVARYEQGQFHVAYAWEVFAGRTMRDSPRFLPGDFEAAKRQAEPEVRKAFDAFLSPYGLNHQSDGVHLIYDEQGPGHAISELSKQLGVDLIVLGTIARSHVAGALIGSTAESVLDNVECSVLTIKPDAFVSPVTLSDKQSL